MAKRRRKIVRRDNGKVVEFEEVKYGMLMMVLCDREGSFPDLIEIDAASNRGIDDIRSIRDAVSYAPIKGKYKVYILDDPYAYQGGL